MPILGLYYAFLSVMSALQNSLFLSSLSQQLPTNFEALQSLLVTFAAKHWLTYRSLYVHFGNVYVAMLIAYLLFSSMHFFLLTAKAVYWFITLPVTLLNYLFSRLFQPEWISECYDNSQWVNAEGPAIDFIGGGSCFAEKEPVVAANLLQQQASEQFEKDNIFCGCRTMIRVTLRIFPSSDKRSDKRNSMTAISVVVPGDKPTVNSLLKACPEYKDYRIARNTTFLSLDDVLEQDDILNLIHRS